MVRSPFVFFLWLLIPEFGLESVKYRFLYLSAKKDDNPERGSGIGGILVINPHKTCSSMPGLMTKMTKSLFIDSV